MAKKTTTPQAVANPVPAGRQVTLSDGRIVTLRDLKVRDAIEARKIVNAMAYANKAGGEPDPQEITAAMLVQIATITTESGEVKRMTYQEVLDMKFTDFAAIATEMGTGLGTGFSPAQAEAS